MDLQDVIRENQKLVEEILSLRKENAELRELLANIPQPREENCWPEKNPEPVSCSQCHKILRTNLISEKVFGFQGFSYCEKCFDRVKQRVKLDPRNIPPCRPAPPDDSRIRCMRCEGLIDLRDAFRLGAPNDPYCEECYESIRRHG